VKSFLSGERGRAILLLLLANLFWGLSFPLIKGLLLLQHELLPGVGGWFPLLFTIAPRFLLAVLILLALQPRESWRATPKEWRQGVLLGLFAAGGMLLQNDGLQYTSASTSAFLTQFYAILIPVWIGWRARRNPGTRVWVCCALVLAGVAVLGRFDPFNPTGAGAGELRFGRGEWETLLSSLFFMGQILVLEQPRFAGNRAARITFVMFVTEALVFCGLALAVAPDAGALLVPLTSPAWLIFTLALCGFCTIGAFSLMNACQPKITATEAGLIYCIEPIFASVLALFLPALMSRLAGIDYANETATGALLIGGGLITAANVIAQLKPPARE
jgi:drug/metabolite transporter (DMT)-like permease